MTVKEFLKGDTKCNYEVFADDRSYYGTGQYLLETIPEHSLNKDVTETSADDNGSEYDNVYWTNVFT